MFLDGFWMIFGWFLDGFWVWFLGLGFWLFGCGFYGRYMVAPLRQVLIEDRGRTISGGRGKPALTRLKVAQWDPKIDGFCERENPIVRNG